MFEKDLFTKYFNKKNKKISIFTFFLYCDKILFILAKTNNNKINKI